jgi:hypothetical protein
MSYMWSSLAILWPQVVYEVLVLGIRPEGVRVVGSVRRWVRRVRERTGRLSADEREEVLLYAGGGEHELVVYADFPGFGGVLVVRIFTGVRTSPQSERKQVHQDTGLAEGNSQCPHAAISGLLFAERCGDHRQVRNGMRAGSQIRAQCAVSRSAGPSS